MTPKEKAEELYWKYIDLTSLYPSEAKKCAIVAVDEMLKHMSLHFGQIGLSTVEYWSEVKKEIEQL